MSELADLLELLFAAPHRAPTVHATIRRWKGLGQRRPDEPGTRTWRLWERPDQWRTEEDVEGAGTAIVVVSGHDWWEMFPGEGLTTGDGDPPPPREPTVVIDSFLANLGWFDLRLQGEEEVLGRSCLRVQATVRPVPGWTATARPLRGDDHRFWVDRERGRVLRLESHQGPEKIDLTEHLEISFDADLPAALFGDPPAGVTSRTSEERTAAFFVSLDEAVVRAPFTVVVPQRLPEFACLTTVLLGPRRHEVYPTVDLIYSLSGGRHLSVVEAATEAAFGGEPSGWERAEIEGQVVRISPPLRTERGRERLELRIRRHGTHVQMAISGTDRQGLIEAALSLAPAGHGSGVRS